MRRVVWGKLRADVEVRDGEQIRACHLQVERNYTKRKQWTPRAYKST